MAQTLRKIDRVIHKIMLFLADAAILVMVLIVTMTAALRVFGKGFGWAEEVPKLMVGLFAFLSCSMGVRDKLHVSVSVIFNLLPKDGRAQRALDFLIDFIILLCGVFMLWQGGSYVLKLMGRPGVLPMTGLRYWVQFVPIPVAGAVIVFDSILFLTGVNRRDGDKLYEQPEEDEAGEVSA